MLLLVATILALICSNSSLADLYGDFLTISFLSKPLLLWVNEGLMAVFFLLVGLELKREICVGGLSSRSRLLLPLVAAVGGMLVPALVFLAFTHGNAIERQGWAIPAATDIAFALGVLSLFGKRIPLDLRIFMTALAVIDDLGAIVIIAVFHSQDLSWLSIAGAMLMVAGLLVLSRCQVRRLFPYLILGFLLWLCVLKSGVHATLAGVVLGFFIPLELGEAFEKKLHPWVTYLVMPIFAFANAGISFAGITGAFFLKPVFLGIALGLCIGKPLGIFLFSWLLLKWRRMTWPGRGDVLPFLAVAMICGIGFTMSLFLGSLVFGGEGSYPLQVRLGVMLGSLCSGLGGALLLLYAVSRKRSVGEH
jgi:NhaA family Na+:H+ antiporter